jgi:predicted nucleic acid-binding protein
MKYVIDASVAVRWKLKASHYVEARRLRSDYERQIHELLAPETIIWETANAFIKAERGRVIPAGEAKTYFYDFLRTQPLSYGASQFIHAAMDLALQTIAGLYDSMYVTLAQREKCEFFTTDDRLIRTLQGQGRFAFVRSIATY